MESLHEVGLDKVQFLSGPWPIVGLFLELCWLGWFLWLLMMPRAEWQRMIPLFAFPVLVIAVAGMHWCSYTTNFFRKTISGVNIDEKTVQYSAYQVAWGSLILLQTAAIQIFAAALAIFWNYRKFQK